MNGKWARAEEPLHWLVDSPDPVHSGDPNEPRRALGPAAQDADQGRRPGLPFAVAMVEQTRRADRPGRLCPRRHEHGAVEPGQEGGGGQEPLRLDAAAGPACRRQGQGRALVPGRERRHGGDASKVYPASSPTSSPRCAPTSTSPTAVLLRADRPVHQRTAIPKGWNAVQEAQRRLPERVPNTAVVSVIDLELDDAIHVGTQGLKRARAARWPGSPSASCSARSAQPLRRSTASPEAPHNTLIVKFKGVNMRIGTAPWPAWARDAWVAWAPVWAAWAGAWAAWAGHGRHGRGRSDVSRDGHGSKPGRAERARAEARAAHCRLLDPQGGRHADPLDLRGGRGQGPRHRGPEADRPDPREGDPLVRLRPAILIAT